MDQIRCATVVGAAVAICGIVATAAHAQCQVDVVQSSIEEDRFDVFGAAVFDDLAVFAAGSSFTYFRRTGDQWTFEADVPAPMVSANSAIDGNRILFTEFDLDQSVSRGHVYQYAAGELTLDGSFDPGLLALGFGNSLDLNGDTALIGAPFVNAPFTFQGTAYLFERIGSDWALRSALTPSASGPYDNAGSNVRLGDGFALVWSGSYVSGTPTAIWLFTREDDDWVERYQITDPTEVRPGWISVHEDRVAFAIENDPSSPGGAVHIYRLVDHELVLDEKIFPQNPETVLGTQAIQFYGDALLSGSLVFRRIDDAWVELGPTFVAAEDFRAESRGVSGDQVVVGGAARLTGQPTRRRSLFIIDIADLTAGDCDGDGICDVQEVYFDPGVDCDGNWIPDGCELVAGTATDCNTNGILDSCDASYRIDAEACYGIGVGGPPPGSEALLLNTFHTGPAGDTIESVSVSWARQSASAAPITALLYDDPTNDGDPIDAQLLSFAHSTVVTSKCRSQRVAIPPVSLEANRTFFIGVAIRPHMQTGEYSYVGIDRDSSYRVRSWVAYSSPTVDVDVLPANDTFVRADLFHEFFTGNFAIRAHSANGIDCCPADFDDSDVIDLDDLAHLLNDWGACAQECPSDLNADNFVTFDDLALLLARWGDC